MAPRTKQEWRRRAADVRASIEIDHDAHRAPVAEFLAGRHTGGPARWVLAYHAMDGEVDLSPLLDRSELGPFAVTRTPDSGSLLTVHPVGSPVERHRYGFDQPIAGAPTVDLDDVGVVLVPGVAFDRLGTRLGHGVGYYDRLLSRLRPDTALVGMTAGYIVAELPADPHDVPMTHLAGEFGVHPVPLAEPEG